MAWSLQFILVCYLMFGADVDSFQNHTFLRVKYDIFSELTSSELDTTHSESVIECCVSCSMNTNCMSVVYNSESGECFLSSKAISLRAILKPDLPSNIEAFTKQQVNLPLMVATSLSQLSFGRKK